jgi:hypothetical protein
MSLTFLARRHFLMAFSRPIADFIDAGIQTTQDHPLGTCW